MPGSLVAPQNRRDGGPEELYDDAVMSAVRPRMAKVIYQADKAPLIYVITILLQVLLINILDRSKSADFRVVLQARLG